MFFRDVFAPEYPNISPSNGNGSGLPTPLPRLLNRSTVKAMQNFVNLTNDWYGTMKYGSSLYLSAL